MPSLGTLKLIGTIAGALALLAVVGAAWGHLRHVEAGSAAYDACRALQRGGLPSTGVACDAAIAADLAHAKRASACEIDLSAGPGRAWAAAEACAAPIAALLAERDTLRSEVADRDRAIDTLKAGQAAAVARAEARAATVERNNRNADAALASAPRDPGGRILCDAGCLRELAGEPSRP